MPGSLCHDVEDLLDVLERHVIVKQVAHRVDKDCPGLTPSQWLIEQIRLQRQSETVSVAVLVHGLQAQRHPFCVAMLAAGADLRATGYGIPGDICPFD
jgi:hypothetical protein